MTISLFDMTDTSEWASIDWKLYEYPGMLHGTDACEVIAGVLFRDNVLLSYPLLSPSREYHVPEGVQIINGYIFQSGNLERITIPSTCHTIRNCVQSPEGKLASIDVSSLNESFASVDGVLYSKDLKTLLCFPKDKNSTEYHVCDQTTEIAPDSFVYNQYIKAVVLPEGIETIGCFAFYSAGIESINLPSTITSFDIEAFENCPFLKAIYVKKDTYAEEVLISNSDSGYTGFTDLLVYQ